MCAPLSASPACLEAPRAAAQGSCGGLTSQAQLTRSSHWWLVELSSGAVPSLGVSGGGQSCRSKVQLDLPSLWESALGHREDNHRVGDFHVLGALYKEHRTKVKCLCL